MSHGYPLNITETAFFLDCIYIFSTYMIHIISLHRDTHEMYT